MGTRSETAAFRKFVVRSERASRSDSRVLQMIEDTVGPPGPTRWGLWALRPLPTYLDGRVLLMGDAVGGVSKIRARF